MPYCLFDRTTARYVGGILWDPPSFDPATHVLLILPAYPDREAERWDGATGVRPATPEELAAALAAARDLEATKIDLWLRSALRVLAPLLPVPMQPQDLIQAVREEYRRQLDQGAG
jgi:hypothetical protein